RWRCRCHCVASARRAPTAAPTGPPHDPRPPAPTARRPAAAAPAPAPVCALPSAASAPSAAASELPCNAPLFFLPCVGSDRGTGPRKGTVGAPPNFGGCALECGGRRRFGCFCVCEETRRASTADLELR